MEKINAVLVMLNREALKETLKKLNLDNVNLATIIADTGEKFFPVGENRIPMVNFSSIHKTVKTYKEYLWLVSGSASEDLAADKMKNFLMTFGVLEENIIRLEAPSRISKAWQANLRHVEEHGADFFATGNEYMQNGLDLKYIPCVYVDKENSRGGVNLAKANQSLRQSYQTAKYVFEHVEPGTIKFVFIGLEPESLLKDSGKTFAEENIPAELRKTLLNDENVQAKAAAKPDLNFKSIKAQFNHEFSAKSISDWKVSKTLAGDFPEENLQILKDYVELCLLNGAKPIGVVFPLAVATRKSFDKKLLKNFRATLTQLEENYDFICVDMSDIGLSYECFCDMAHLNSTGRIIANAQIGLTLYKKKLLPIESFCDMNYEYFYIMSLTTPKDEYNALMDDVFKKSLEKIRAKEKIKVGFVAIEAANWCGDDLYNFFASNERFETTVFLSKGFHKDQNEIVEKDFWLGVEQLKSHGLNVVALEKLDAPVPEQDVFIFLTPYLDRIVQAFLPENITAKTLITYIPYTFEMAVHNRGFYGKAIFSMVWKAFFSSAIELKMCKKKSVTGMPHGFFL